MARIFVFNDNLTVRVEIMVDDGNKGSFVAICPGHTSGRGLDHDNLVGDSHERRHLADTIEVAMQHADSCTRCADPACRTESRHDAGHRCRKGD